MTKSSAKTARRKTRHKPRKAASKTAGKVGKKVAAERVQNIQRKMDAPLEPSRSTTVQDTFRGLAERNVTQTRERYEHSKSTLNAVLESWQRSFGAAGQGAIALNRKIIDVAERNINNSFDLATHLAGAKNIVEVMEVQAAYWRKQFSEMRTQAEEVRVLSTRVATDVARPIKSQYEAALARRNQ